MSIAGMIRLAVARQAQEERGARRTAEGALESAMHKIAAFIPSEIIGIYIAGFGIISPESAVGKWWIFGICLALIPVLTALSYWEQRKQGVELRRRKAVIIVVFAVIAFIGWAAALPGTPFLSITPNATRIGGFCVVIFAAVMYRAAALIGIAPRRP